jgi:hypothetical protein
MSISKYLWNAVWREVGNVTRGIQTVAVTIPFMITLAVGLNGGEWSKEFWPTWVWALITFSIAILAIFRGIAQRGYTLEKASIPKLELVFAQGGIWFKQFLEGDYQTSEIRIGIKNDSDTIVKGVEFILANVRSAMGEDNHDVARALLSEDSRNARVDINPGEIKYFLVAKTRQLLVGLDELAIIFLGPFQSGEKIKIASQIKYRLKMRVSGESSPARDYLFRLEINEKGKLLFSPCPHDQNN